MRTRQRATSLNAIFQTLLRRRRRRRGGPKIYPESAERERGGEAIYPGSSLIPWEIYTGQYCPAILLGGFNKGEGEKEEFFYFPTLQFPPPSTQDFPPFLSGVSPSLSI